MRINFTKLLFLGTVFFSVQSQGQNDPYFTHYMLNKLAYNPAVAGEKDAICLSALTHQQWLGQTDQSNFYKDGNQNPLSGVNPATNTISLTMPLLKRKQLGIGVMATTDKLGYNKYLYLRGSAAWKFGLGRQMQDGSYEQIIAAGLDFGIVQASVDGQKLNPLMPGDPNIPTTLVNGKKMDMGAGVYYTHQRIFDGIYAGISMTHLNAPEVKVPGSLTWQTTRYLYVLAGTQHEFGNLTLMPSILLKPMATPFQVDLGCRAMLNDKFVLGGNYRTGDAISLMAGYYILPHFYAGYAYDATVSKVRNHVSSGTHELFVSYCFTISVEPPPVRPRYNVRYLEGYTIY